MNIGLVLSGGMAKGAYQIGALRALGHFVPLNEVKHISCASVGVLNGYAYATDNLDHAEQMWKDLCGEDTKIIITKLLKSNALQQNISNIYDPEKQLLSNFYCALLDMSNRQIIYKDLSAVDNNNIPLYLKASVAMPVYNRSVQLDDTSYFDGAMVDNIPVYPLLKHDLDYLICIYFDDAYFKFENAHFDNKVIKITFPAKSMLKESLVFTKDRIDEMIRDGYDRTTELLQTVFAEGYENLDHIYHTIDEMNQNNKGNRLRITGDVLVTNLNKITQRLTKRKLP